MRRRLLLFAVRSAEAILAGQVVSSGFRSSASVFFEQSEIILRVLKARVEWRAFISFQPFFMANANAKEPDMAQSSNKPEKVFRLRGISASIFANKAKSEGRDITFRKVSVQRAYKDGDDWKNTTSFGRDDLPVLQIVLQRAHEFILDTEAGGKNDEE